MSGMVNVESWKSQSLSWTSHPSVGDRHVHNEFRKDEHSCPYTGCLFGFLAMFSLKNFSAVHIVSLSARTVLATASGVEPVSRALRNRCVAASSAISTSCASLSTMSSTDAAADPAAAGADNDPLDVFLHFAISACSAGRASL